MARARRDWSAMLVEIRLILREETAADSFWDDALLLNCFNECMDLRVMELAEAHEGWITDTFQADIVAGQADYALIEGADRVKRVQRVYTEGSRTFKVPLTRFERWGESTYNDSSALQGNSAAPTYRVLGNLIRLEPTPTESEVNGLEIDVEFLPDRLVNTTDKLSDRFPTAMETLLIFDTVVLAMSIEAAKDPEAGNFRPSSMLLDRRNEYAGRFIEFTAVRTFGRTFTQGFDLGD